MESGQETDQHKSNEYSKIEPNSIIKLVIERNNKRNIEK